MKKKTKGEWLDVKRKVNLGSPPEAPRGGSHEKFILEHKPPLFLDCVHFVSPV